MRPLVFIILILLIWGCSGNDRPTTPGNPAEPNDTTPPTVISTCPANGDTDVDVNACISCTFSEPMDPSMFARWSFYLDADVIGSFFCDDCTATFDPTFSLKYGQKYTATVTWCVTDTAGNAMGANYSWSFTTTSAPSVVVTDPVDGDSGISLDAVLSVTFSRPMDPKTITSESFYLSRGDMGLWGSISYDSMTATFTPNGDLEYNRTYTAILTKAITDINGNPLEHVYTWSFTTDTVSIMPLAVGNRWLYHVEKYNVYGIPTADYHDTLLIEQMEMIEGKTWFIDDRSRQYTNRGDGLWKIGLSGKPYLLAEFPSTAGHGYTGDPIWEEMGFLEVISVMETNHTVTVDAGFYSCYYYMSWIEERFRYLHFYAPSVGLIKYEIYQNFGMKSWPALIERRTLVDFNIQ